MTSAALFKKKSLLQIGLQSLYSYCIACLDNTFKAVYEPRGHAGEVVRFLTCLRMILKEKVCIKRCWNSFETWIFDDLEQRQLQIDRNSDSSGPALEEMNAARERAIASLEEEISAAQENNDLERE